MSWTKGDYDAWCSCGHQVRQHSLMHVPSYVNAFQRRLYDGKNGYYCCEECSRDSKTGRRKMFWDAKMCHTNDFGHETNLDFIKRIRKEMDNGYQVICR
jgi:hypothetical protein